MKVIFVEFVEDKRKSIDMKGKGGGREKVCKGRIFGSEGIWGRV